MAELHPLSHSVVVTWENRPKRGKPEVHALRFSSIDQFPRRAAVVEEKWPSPVFILSASGPILRNGYWPEASGWSIPAAVPEL